MSPTKADIGLIVFGIAVPPALTSVWLPSPSTAYDKASGHISSGPASVRLLKRGEVMGTAIGLAVAAASALVASEAMGASAAWIFVGAVAIQAIFLWEYERAFKLGEQDARVGE